MTATADTVRRHLLATAGLWALAGHSAAATEPPTGWVSPRPPAPALPLQCADGRIRSLRQLLTGQVSAVQLMFTGCNGSCPVQGALFADIASRLPPLGMQLLSISVDTLGDDARTLHDWQGRFGRHAGWMAGVPRGTELDALTSYLRGIDSAAGTHTAQVFVFDRQARLAYRTGDAPRPANVQALLDHVAHQPA